MRAHTCPVPPAVPGDLGNQLEAKLDKPTVVHYLCSKKTESYFTIWLNLELLLPVIIDCWIDNIRWGLGHTAGVLLTNRPERPPEPVSSILISRSLTSLLPQVLGLVWSGRHHLCTPRQN